jgi:hypothetical protein
MAEREFNAGLAALLKQMNDEQLTEAQRAVGAEAAARKPGLDLDDIKRGMTSEQTRFAASEILRVMQQREAAA